MASEDMEFVFEVDLVQYMNQMWSNFNHRPYFTLKLKTRFSKK